MTDGASDWRAAEEAERAYEQMWQERATDEAQGYTDAETGQWHAYEPGWNDPDAAVADNEESRTIEMLDLAELASKQAELARTEKDDPHE